MKLIFKQRLFSWFDSYDIYYEDGSIAFTVEGKLAWGHCLHILSPEGEHIGTVKQVLLTFLPKFELYAGEEYIGNIRRELTLFQPHYTLEYNDWQVSGDFLEWDYNIEDSNSRPIATIRKELLHWTDTYIIDVTDPNNALLALMVVLAIDAEKCSRD